MQADHERLGSVQHFRDRGAEIAAIDEPEPSPDTPPELLPPRVRRGERSTFFGFLFFVLEAR